MIVYDVATKVLDTAQHRWPDLWHYVYCFVTVRRSLYGGRKYTHTHTHTHTHARTHASGEVLLCKMQAHCSLKSSLGLVLLNKTKFAMKVFAE